MNKTFESLSSDYIEDNIYQFKIEVFDGPTNKLSPMLCIDVYFVKDDKIEEQIGLAVDWYKGSFWFEPYHTSIVYDGQRFENYENPNDFLYDLVSEIKKWVKSKDTSLGIYSENYNFIECYESHINSQESEYPPIVDYRKSHDIGYLYVVSVGIKNSANRTCMYKKQISQEQLFGFLEWGFFGYDDYYDDGVFYKVFIQNKIMSLKDYEEIFLKYNKKRKLNYGLDDELEIRSVYDANGNGIRCPECNSFIKYSVEMDKYRCISCNKEYSKKHLSENNNPYFFYEEFSKIFK